MKQNISKIILLGVALVLIIGAITLMVNTVSVSAPVEPDLRPAVSRYADSLTAIYNDGAYAAEYSRALDFNNLCLREGRIETRVCDRNVRSLVSDSASRAYSKFRMIYDNASSWGYSSLQSALEQMEALKELKLSDGSTQAMDNRCDSYYAELQQIKTDYRQGKDLCSKDLRGNVNYQNASGIINDANNFLASHPELNNNTEIAWEHSNMKLRLTRYHVNTIKGKIREMRERRFSNPDELNSCIRPITESIQNFRTGVGNSVYVSNVASADNLLEELGNSRNEIMRAWEAAAE